VDRSCVTCFLIATELHEQIRQRQRFLLMVFFYHRLLTGDSEKTRQFLTCMTQAQLLGHILYDPYFKSSYAPWTQSMCLCPDSDFFKSLHSKRADVATGIIRTADADGVCMENGDKIDADFIITATGPAHEVRRQR
jgi:hypothetical protein